jgi:hypothetical protein
MGLWNVGTRHHAVTAWESAEEKQAALCKAFDARGHELTDPDLAEFQRFLGRLVVVLTREGAAAFWKLVDCGSLIRRIESYPNMQRLNWLWRLGLRRLVPPGPWVSDRTEGFQLVHLERPAADNAILYVFAREKGADERHVLSSLGERPYRFWLCQAKGEWRLFDWESIELGRSAAAAALVRIASRDPQFPEYRRCLRDIARAERMVARGDFEGAAKRLRAASQRAVPAVLADAWHYELYSRDPQTWANSTT